MKKFIIATIIAISSITAFAEEHVSNEPDEIALIAELKSKLQERDLTIQEMREAQLDLLVENLSLKEANQKLRGMLRVSQKDVAYWQNKSAQLRKDAEEQIEDAQKVADAQVKAARKKAAEYRRVAQAKVERARKEFIGQIKAIKFEYN